MIYRYLLFSVLYSPYISFPSLNMTISFTVFCASVVPLSSFLNCGKIKGAFAAYDIDSDVMGAKNIETGFPVSAGGPALKGLEPLLSPASLCRLLLLRKVRVLIPIWNFLAARISIPFLFSGTACSNNLLSIVFS
jgi:hypothetical protein